MKVLPTKTQDSILINKVHVNNKSHKSFAQTLTGSKDKICDIPMSQLPRLCIKGDELSIFIPEEEYYVARLEGCKTDLHDRVLLSKRMLLSRLGP